MREISTLLRIRGDLRTPDVGVRDGTGGGGVSRDRGVEDEGTGVGGEGAEGGDEGEEGGATKMIVGIV